MMILFNGFNQMDNELNKVNFKMLISKVAILDIFGLALPVIVFYYLIYRLKSRILAKAVPYLVNTVLIFMGPITLLSSVIFINNESKDVLLLAYISFFFISHSLLISCYIPSILSASVFCVCG